VANPLTSSVLVVLTLLSLAACGVAVARLRGSPERAASLAGVQAWLVGVIGIACAGLFAYRWLFVHGRWQPLAAHVDGLLLIAALLAGVVLFVQARPRLFGLSAFALPLLSLILAWAICAAAWTYRPFSIETLHPVWKGAHLGGVYLGTLSSVVAAVAGGMYLFVQSRLKRKVDPVGRRPLASLETLEGLIIRGATLGFVLLTVGLIAGAVILIEDGSAAGEAFLVTKIVLACVAWLVYAVLMNVRYTSSFRGARAAWLSIAGLTLLLATYAIVTALPGDREPRAKAFSDDAARLVEPPPAPRSHHATTLPGGA
jgi:ABC-type uncharacterized transport system permease subunit